MSSPNVVLFRDVFPEDLWRGGDDSGRDLLTMRIPPHKRPDVIPYPLVANGLVVPYAPALTGGLSLWNGPHPAVKRGWWWVIPKNTPLPTGLVLVPASYLSSGLRHYLIAPEKTMSLKAFQEQVNQLKQHAARQYVIG